MDFYPTILSIIIIIILAAKIMPKSSSGHFPVGFYTNVLYSFLCSLVHVIYTREKRGA